MTTRRPTRLLPRLLPRVLPRLIRRRNPVPGFARQRALIEASGLFDPAWYRARYPDLQGAKGLNLLVHYLQHGGREGRWPHPLFHGDAYLAENPDVARGGTNPLLHFVEHGWREGRNPNPLFRTKWYVNRYLQGRAGSENPLLHFLANPGNHPGPDFDATWYAATYLDPAEVAANPLVHYFTVGRQRQHRRQPSRSGGAGLPPPAADARITCLKRAPRTGARTALLVTHAPAGRLKGHVGPYAEALREAGTDVVLIVAADRRRSAVPAAILDLCTAVYVRENSGFDFAAWAHVLSIDEDLMASRVLYLTNDSIIGPLDRAAFAGLLDRIDGAEEDLVGLTDNHYGSWHLQSFFIAIKARCLASYAFSRFVLSVKAMEDKNDVITEYETTFSVRMQASGFTAAALFPIPDLDNLPDNRTIYAWDDLLAQGFPFIKASLVLGEHRDKGGAAVLSALEGRGFDLHRLEPTYAHAGADAGTLAWADLEAPRRPGPPRLAFVAPLTYANGLGVAARGYLRALHRTPWRVGVHPVTRPFHVHGRVAPAWQAPAFTGAPDAVVVHLNGGSWEELLNDDQRALIAAARRRIGLLVWETSHVPDGWLKTLDGLDAIWTPSAFCAEIFRAVTDIPVSVVPHVVENEAPGPADPGLAGRVRATFGLDPARRIVLYAFDGSSFLARKNPEALVRAFAASGLAGAGWQLVLKTKHLSESGEAGRELAALAAAAEHVVLIDRPMARLELDGLFRMADIYASPHASEGFGLTIAEAMELGKAVVATDFGGSRDFLDASCGFPVRAEVAALAQSHGPYLRGSLWGRVDEADLARQLAAAAATVAGPDGARLAEAARARIRAMFSAEAVARSMQAALRALEAAPGPADRAEDAA
ncbi:rhamnan synthesis F family protein [Methylobacterium sp. A54F]